MEVSGYKIMNAIKDLQFTRNIVGKQFEGNLKKYDSDKGADVHGLMEQYVDLERKISKLQYIQGVYNLQCSMYFYGKTVSLHEAVKMIGGLGRIENMWKDASKLEEDSGGSRLYGEGRKADEEYKKLVIPINDCIKLAKEASRRASSLRGAIQQANSTIVDIKEATSDLFE